MKMLSDKDSFLRQLLLLIAATLQTFVLLTIIANFGWTEKITIISYTITFAIYYVIYVLWKK